MIPAHETFDGTFPFKPHFSEAAGFSMHYVDEGEGEPIICLHGEPTWGYLYRRFIPPLSKTHRVIVPDHMGFGKSQTPQEKEYRLWTHVENLAALTEELDLWNITFVVQDWGGPISAGYTVRYPERVKRFCLMNTLLGYGALLSKIPPLHTSPWFTWIAEKLKDGSYYEVMENLGSTVLSVMKFLGLDSCGGIFNLGTISITNSFVTGNMARFSGVGGICNGGSMTINSSTISGNDGGDSVGGISNFLGTLSIYNSNSFARVCLNKSL